MGNTSSEAGSRAGEASSKTVSQILVEELKKDEVCIYQLIGVYLQLSYSLAFYRTNL